MTLHHFLDMIGANLDYTGLNLSKEDIVLIAVPSYGGRVPALAAQRITKIHGNQARCVIVCVYGNRAYEDTLIELNDIAEKCNFQVISAIAAIAEHSIMHQYATKRPDPQDVEELHTFSKKILEKLNTYRSVCDNALSIPRNRPYKQLKVASLIPKVNDNCISCGLCAKYCPAQAISRESIRTTDSEKCISCMRCVRQCPQAARKVDDTRVSALASAVKKACSVRKSNELYI